MSDPFSVASSAVGIISLGLQVTQGLVTYYSQFKAFDSDIAEISRKANGLHGILQVLEVPLRKFEADNAPVPAQVRAAISASEEGLRNLNGWIEKYGKAEPPANIEDRLRLLRKRTLFPFRRDTLLGLKSTLESLQSNLDTAIQVLHLDATHRQYDLVLSASTAASAHTEAIQDRLQSQAELMESVSTRLDELVSTIQQHQNQSSLLFREPALLATLCDSHHDLRRDTLSVLQSGIRQKIRKPRPALSKGSFCSCKGRTRTSESYISTRSLSAFWSRKTQHLPYCPLYARGERTDILGAKYTSCSKALGNSIAVAISITRGAGGFAISPQLQFRAVVSNDSPAFALLSYESAFRTPMKDVDKRADLILKQMYQLFQDGKASPTDVLSDGRTLLHAAIFWAFNFTSDQFSKRGLKYVPQVAALQKIIRTLVGAGARAEECRTSIDGPATILCDLIRMSSLPPDNGPFSTTLHGLVSDLLDYGLAIEAELMADCSRTITTSRIVNNLVCSGHGGEVFDVPQVFKQILLRSENGLKELLMRSPDSSNEVVGAQRTTPLQLSCLWPIGISILLNAGAVISTADAYGWSPLAYACYSRCEESIQLLLDNDSGLGCDNRPNFCLSGICLIDNIQVRRSFISALVDRRERLRKLAALVLPDEESSRFNLNSAHLLDVQAADVTKSVLELGISVEPALLPSPFLKQETVYHTNYLNVSMADLLYDAGFQDIESTDDYGLTPLMSHTSITRQKEPEDFGLLIDLIKWLISKGGDIYREDTIRGGTAVHNFGWNIGYRIYESYNHTYKHPDRSQSIYLTLGEAQQHTIIDFLTDPFEDSCICACSKRGCRAISSATKGSGGIWQPWRFGSFKPVGGIWLRTPDGLFLVDNYTADFLEPERRRCPWLPHYILRVMTFNVLGLTHTCHYKGFWRRPPLPQEEILEIQSEEQFMIQELESLMAEFDAKLSEVGGTLTSFLKEHWMPRMEEVLNADDETLDEEELRKMREIGVVLE